MHKHTQKRSKKDTSRHYTCPFKMSFQDALGPCGLQVKSFGAELLACARGTRLRKLRSGETVNDMWTTCEWHVDDMWANSNNDRMLRHVQIMTNKKNSQLKVCFDRWMLSLSAFASARREPGRSIQHTKWSCLAWVSPEIGWHEHAAHSAERSGVSSLVAGVSIGWLNFFFPFLYLVHPLRFLCFLLWFPCCLHIFLATISAINAQVECAGLSLHKNRDCEKEWRNTIHRQGKQKTTHTVIVYMCNTYVIHVCFSSSMCLRKLSQQWLQKGTGGTTHRCEHSRHSSRDVAGLLWTCLKEQRQGIENIEKCSENNGKHREPWQL